jgi:uncharacterized membrane protein YfcA
MSLAVVLTALPTRLVAVPYSTLLPRWPIVLNLLAGSLIGAWSGASWTTRMGTITLQRMLAVLLVVMAVAWVLTHRDGIATLSFPTSIQTVVEMLAGFCIA